MTLGPRLQNFILDLIWAECLIPWLDKDGELCISDSKGLQCETFSGVSEGIGCPRAPFNAVEHSRPSICFSCNRKSYALLCMFQQ